MVEQRKKLLDLTKKTGYPLVQQNGQRKYGPPPEWVGPPPARGCEVFVGRIPRNMFENELVPIFEMCGKIYEMRLMMNFSGTNRGYAFVTFTNRSDASRAVQQLDNYEILIGWYIAVVKSVNNCRLFVSGIPKTKTKEEVHEELSKLVTGIVDVIMPKNCFDRRLNLGFAFVEFTSHYATAMARRALVSGRVKLWDHEVDVDWAEPEPYVDDEQMKKSLRSNLIQYVTPTPITNVYSSMVPQMSSSVGLEYYLHYYMNASLGRQPVPTLRNV